MFRPLPDEFDNEEEMLVVKHFFEGHPAYGNVSKVIGSHLVVGDPGVPSVPDVKKIPCPKCNSTFTRVDNLRRHMRTFHSEQEECSLDPANSVEAVMESPPKKIIGS